MNLIKLRVVVFLLFQVHLAFCKREKTIATHVRNEINGGGDSVSTPTRRTYQIYSQMTGKFLQVLGRKVDANGVSGDKYAKMEISSIAFGGRIMIRGVATGRYICMNKRGRPIGKKRRLNDRCKFTENMTESRLDFFTNVRNPRWYLAFQANGKPKRASKTSKSQTEGLFLKRPMEHATPVSTQSPSTVDEQTWTDLENRIRESYLQEYFNRQNRPQTTVSRKSVQQSLPSKTDIGKSKNEKKSPSIPPEIQQEIEIRRLIANNVEEEVSSNQQARASALSTVQPTTRKVKTGKKEKKRRRKGKGKKRGRKQRITTEFPKDSRDLNFDIKVSKKKKQRRNRQNNNQLTSESPFQSMDSLAKIPTISTPLQKTVTQPTKKRDRSARKKKSKNGSKKSKTGSSSSRNNRKKHVT